MSAAGPKAPSPLPSPTPSVVHKPRSVRSLERPTRLPVWPAWNGVIFILLDLLGQRDLAAKLEDWLGGRVCPMMLDAREADPFILLVHHRHSFQRFDPLRAVFRLLLAEGFPAHPHRGFETVTYVLPGRRGLVHRDSLGFKMRYSDGDAQWMTAGRGMLHEEMWETDANEDGVDGGDDGIAGVSNMGLSSDAELYQLWLNLPPASKMVDPKIQLVRPSAKGDAVEAAAAALHGGGEPHTPQQQQQQQQQEQGGNPARLSVVGLPSGEPSPGVTTRLLSGEAHGLRSDTQTYSPVTVIHATLTDEGGAGGKASSGRAVRWELPLPSTYTCLVYVRQGSVDVVSGAAPASRRRLGTHELAYLDRGAGTDGQPFDGLCLELPREGDEGGYQRGEGCDLMVFAGEPLRAPVASSGTMVMNSNEEVERAFADYQRGDFGIPWEHEISDEEWTAKVQAAAAARQGRR